MRDLSGACLVRSAEAKKTLQSGERGIRTLETLSSPHAFQACALSRSAISPREGKKPHLRGRLLAHSWGAGKFELTWCAKTPVFGPFAEEHMNVFGIC